MRRVVVTGFGIVSSIGNDRHEVLNALRDGRSGIEFCPEYAELGLRSQVCGSVHIDTEALIDRKLRRFMGDAAAFNYIAMQQAIEDAGLNEAQVSNPRAGLIVGSGGASHASTVAAADILREKGTNRFRN